MIIKAEIEAAPLSGDYRERIYDISSPWNSQDWTWIKFENDNFTQWFGHFRGSPRSVSVSQKHNKVLVLTSDYLFLLDRLNGEMIENEFQPQYQSLTVSPLGDFIIADYYNIEIIKSSLTNKQLIESPIQMQMDFITFQSWNRNILLITCEEFLNSLDNQMELELDVENMKLSLK
jgi:hypothetical protein